MQGLGNYFNTELLSNLVLKVYSCVYVLERGPGLSCCIIQINLTQDSNKLFSEDCLFICEYIQDKWLSIN